MRSSFPYFTPPYFFLSLSFSFSLFVFKVFLLLTHPLCLIASRRFRCPHRFPHCSYFLFSLFSTIVSPSSFSLLPLQTASQYSPPPPTLFIPLPQLVLFSLPPLHSFSLPPTPPFLINHYSLLPSTTRSLYSPPFPCFVLFYPPLYLSPPPFSLSLCLCNSEKRSGELTQRGFNDRPRNKPINRPCVLRT